MTKCQQLDSFCRSELAREKLTGAAFIQGARVIVDAFREQARSYSPHAFQRPSIFTQRDGGMP